ncbi:MAG: thioesterase family protein [Polaromonas sp.]
MKDSLMVGTKHFSKLEIDKRRTISFMGEGLRVYSTPSLVLDLERTCRVLLLDHHDAGEDSVGARVEVDHLSPTLLGQFVTVEAVIVELALPRVTFEVEVKDELDIVGRAKHVRFIVDKVRQKARLDKKAARVKAAAGN